MVTAVVACSSDSRAFLKSDWSELDMEERSPRNVNVIVGTAPTTVGLKLGESDGAVVGDREGDSVGDDVGDMDGEYDGEVDGDMLGDLDGDVLGVELGDVDGECVGEMLGASVWCEQSPAVVSSRESISDWDVV